MLLSLTHTHTHKSFCSWYAICQTEMEKQRTAYANWLAKFEQTITWNAASIERCIQMAAHSSPHVPRHLELSS